MEALLFPFGSPVKDARTLIESNVEDSVKDPGVVDANADPEKTGRSTKQLASRPTHNVVRTISFPISRLPKAYIEYRSGAKSNVPLPRTLNDRAP